MTEELGHTLRRPRNDDEWRAYHVIRREVLFENRGCFGVYDENHPDELARDNHPLILLHAGVPVGVIRVDVRQNVAWFRRLAVRADLQRAGHGKILLDLAETFAREEGCNEVRSNVAVDAVGFYERCGYSRDVSSQPGTDDSIPMLKHLP